MEPTAERSEDLVADGAGRLRHGIDAPGGADDLRLVAGLDAPIRQGADIDRGEVHGDPADDGAGGPGDRDGGTVRRGAAEIESQDFFAELILRLGFM